MNTRLAIATVLLALLLLSTLGACKPRPDRLPPSNILLITIDTLRADHLSGYGYSRATSPVIDRLGAEGVRFGQAVVQWPKTTPSFTSMFTATYPKDNGIVRKVGIPIPCRFETLAEVLKRNGYATHAVVANGALASDFFFDQGFDTFIETWKLVKPGSKPLPNDPNQPNAPLPPGTPDPNGAEAVTRLAMGLLNKLDKGGKPYFLWVHYLDPHYPYSPPPPYRDRFQDDALFRATPRKIDISPDKPDQQMFGIGSHHVLDGRDDLPFYVARYDAEIAYTDAQIGRLLDEMKRRKLLGKTLTVLTADHGESLGDHNYYFDHGRFGFDTCLRVPLIFHYPGVLKPRVDADPVELLNLAPTLLEAAGVDLKDGAWMQGRSLTPRLRGQGGQGGQAPPPPPSPTTTAASAASAARTPGKLVAHPGLAFSEAGWEANNKWQKIVRDGRFKLVFAQTRPEQRWIGGEGVRFTLYDLKNDPHETKNVADQYPDDLKRLQRELSSWAAAPRFPVAIDTEGGTCGGGQRPMDEQTRELLHSLGYI
jgi:arylsulfatase A-like enzyme